MFEFIASLPPLRITTLPVLRQRAAASTVTFGRDSKIMPITPSGTRVLMICKPFGRFPPPIISPIGSPSAIIWSTPFAMPSIRLASSMSRSCLASDIPFSFAAAMSFAFSAIIRLLFSISAFEIAARALFFCMVEAEEIKASAALALLPSSCV